jgi:hypothetical protein
VNQVLVYFLFAYSKRDKTMGNNPQQKKEDPAEIGKLVHNYFENLAFSLFLDSRISSTTIFGQSQRGIFAQMGTRIICELNAST